MVCNIRFGGFTLFHLGRCLRVNTHRSLLISFFRLFRNGNSVKLGSNFKILILREKRDSSFVLKGSACVVGRGGGETLPWFCLYYLVVYWCLCKHEAMPSLVAIDTVRRLICSLHHFWRKDIGLRARLKISSHGLCWKICKEFSRKFAAHILASENLRKKKRVEERRGG